MAHMKLEDIPTDVFLGVIESHIAAGWRKTYEYENFDAWIDYGKVILAKDGLKLVFVWDNWMEGRIEGPELVLQAIEARIREIRGPSKPTMP